MDGDRYRRAREHDIQVVTSYGDGTHRVNGDRGIDYLVDAERPACTCPDWQKNGSDLAHGCKHIIKINITDDLPDSGVVTSTANQRSNSNREPELSESALPEDWQQRRADVFDRDDWSCRCCGLEARGDGNVELHAHHVDPRSEGGSDALENLLTLCRHCHRKLHGNVPMAPVTNDAGKAVQRAAQRAQRSPEDSLSESIYVPPDPSELSADSAESSPTSQSTRANGVRSEPRTRTAESGSAAPAAEAEEGSVGDVIFAALVLGTPGWLVLEGLFYVLGWQPGTRTTRFLAVVVPLLAVFLLGHVADEPATE